MAHLSPTTASIARSECNMSRKWFPQTAREPKDLHDVCTYDQRRSWKRGRPLHGRTPRQMRISRAERRERELAFRNHLAALKHGTPEQTPTTGKDQSTVSDTTPLYVVRHPSS